MVDISGRRPADGRYSKGKPARCKQLHKKLKRAKKKPAKRKLRRKLRKRGCRVARRG